MSIHLGGTSPLRSGILLVVFIVFGTVFWRLHAEENRAHISPEGDGRIDFPSAPGTYHKIQFTPQLGADQDWEVVDMRLGSDGMQHWSAALSELDARSGFFRIATTPNSHSGDEDGDGMDDVFELTFDNLNPFSNKDFSGDEDADGLSNYKEWQLKLNPTLEDSDADGIVDGYEVRDFFSDPGLPNQTTILQEIAGADILDSRGRWTTNGTAIVHQSLRGHVYYHFTTQTPSPLMVDVHLRHNGTGTQSFTLSSILKRWQKPEIFLDTKTIRIPEGETRRFQSVLPRELAENWIRIIHNGYDSSKELVIDKVQLRTFDTAHYERLLQATTSYEQPANAAIVGALLEGRCRFPQLVGFYEPQATTPWLNVPGRWAAQILSHSRPNTPDVFFQDEVHGRRIGHTLSATQSMNIFDGGDIHLNHRQQVRLSAFADPDAYQSVTLEVPELNIVRNIPVSSSPSGEPAHGIWYSTLPEFGVFTVNATINDGSAQRPTATRTVIKTKLNSPTAPFIVPPRAAHPHRLAAGAAHAGLRRAGRGGGGARRSQRGN